MYIALSLSEQGGKQKGGGDPDKRQRQEQQIVVRYFEGGQLELFDFGVGGGVAVALDLQHLDGGAGPLGRVEHQGIKGTDDDLDRSEEHTSELQSRFDLV